MLLHPWDDLEQDFLRFTITVKEMAGSIATMVEDPNVPAEVVDSVQNTVNGLIEYVKTQENVLADAIEGKIGYDYRNQRLQQSSWVTQIGDDWMITLPKWVCERLGWAPGDGLKWTVTNDNAAMVKKLDE